MKQLLGKVTINEKWKKTKRGTKYANGFVGGYPGLTLTAKRIADYIPYCKLFVEPFAGLGRVSKKVKAEKIFQKWKDEGSDTIGHLGKRKAIKEMEQKDDFIPLFIKKLQNGTDEEKIELLGQLGWIGNITKYHLARNLGIDCAKPDRHLVRLAEKFGYDNVQDMCKFISKCVGDRIGTVDVVLWRYSNLFGS